MKMANIIKREIKNKIEILLSKASRDINKAVKLLEDNNQNINTSDLKQELLALELTVIKMDSKY